ncbi:hypothetical protein GCM10010421_19890 [Streptomyces glaucus]|uniref:Secreted protein n=1 Tax=Streptomyces glaucus TaxID=284029 RepID=A0ABP5WQB1_9ACTN
MTRPGRPVTVTRPGVRGVSCTPHRALPTDGRSAGVSRITACGAGQPTGVPTALDRATQKGSSSMRTARRIATVLTATAAMIGACAVQASAVAIEAAGVVLELPAL